MEDPENLTQGQIASHTFTYLRRIEGKLGSMDRHVQNVPEVILRQDVRLGRIERDIGELKSDMVLMENQILNRMNEIFHITRQLDEHSERITAVEATMRPQG